MIPNTVKKIIGYGMALSLVVILSAIFFFRQFNVPQDLHPLIIPIAPGTKINRSIKSNADRIPYNSPPSSGLTKNSFMVRAVAQPAQTHAE